MPTKEDIRAKRESLRSNFKLSIQKSDSATNETIPTESLIQVSEKSENEAYSPKKQVSMKSTLDSEDLNCLDKIHDVYT